MATGRDTAGLKKPELMEMVETLREENVKLQAEKDQLTIQELALNIQLEDAKATADQDTATTEQRITTEMTTIRENAEKEITALQTKLEETKSASDQELAAFQLQLTETRDSSDREKADLNRKITVATTKQTEAENTREAEKIASQAMITNLKAKLLEQDSTKAKTELELVRCQARLLEKTNLAEGYMMMLEEKTSPMSWGDCVVEDPDKVLLVCEEQSRDSVMSNIKHGADWHKYSEANTIDELSKKIKSTDFLEMIETFDKVIIFMGYNDIKGGANGQVLYKTTMSIARKMLEQGTDVAIIILPPIAEVNKNCHLSYFNRLLMKTPEDLGIQILSIDHFLDSPMYEILDIEGNISPESCSKVAKEIAQKITIKKIEKKFTVKPAKEEKVYQKPEGIEDFPKVDPEMCIPVPEIYVGRIIGKKGSMIKDIIAETGCKIDLMMVRICEVPEKAAVFTGTPTQVRLAKLRILDIIVKCESEPEQEKRPFSTTSTSNQPPLKKYR